MLKIAAFIDKISDALGKIASVLLILLVLIVVYNVVARYAFRASSLAIEELSWHCYAAIFLLGIPFALKSGSHVRVDLFYERFSAKTKAWIDLIGSFIFLIPMCLVIIWAGWQFTMAAYSLGAQPDSPAAFFQQLLGSGIGEKSQDVGGLLNRWIIKGVIPLSFFFLLLSSLSFIISKIIIIKGLNK